MEELAERRGPKSVCRQLPLHIGNSTKPAFKATGRREIALPRGGGASDPMSGLRTSGIRWRSNSHRMSSGRARQLSSWRSLMGVIEGSAVTAIPDPDTERRRWRSAGRDPSRPAHDRSRSHGDHHVDIGSDRPTRLAAGGCDPSPRWRTLNGARGTHGSSRARLWLASREGRTKDVR